MLWDVFGSFIHEEMWKIYFPILRMNNMAFLPLKKCLLRTLLACLEINYSMKLNLTPKCPKGPF